MVDGTYSREFSAREKGQAQVYSELWGFDSTRCELVTSI